jgi:3-oxoacyl-[acyl-carrier-protein] synthase-3
VGQVPPSIKNLIGELEMPMDSINRWIFHQANGLIIKSICNRLGIPEERVPLTLTDFGNTSSASIPLTLVAKCGDILRTQTERYVFSGFGIGLSWANAILELKPRVVLPLIPAHV